jgi:antitoxin VapB
MSLSIKDPEAARLARAVTQYTGETMTQAVINALRERLAREESKAQEIDGLVDEIMEIGRHFATLPIHDPRRLEEMLYDESGLPA